MAGFRSHLCPTGSGKGDDELLFITTFPRFLGGGVLETTVGWGEYRCTHVAYGLKKGAFHTNFKCNVSVFLMRISAWLFYVREMEL